MSAQHIGGLLRGSLLPGVVLAAVVIFSAGCARPRPADSHVSMNRTPRPLRVVLLPLPERLPPFFWDGLNSLTGDWNPDVLLLSGRVPPNLKRTYEQAIRDFAASSRLKHVTIDWTRFLPEDVETNQIIADDKEYYERRFLAVLSQSKPTEVVRPLKQVVAGRERTGYFGEPALFPFMGLRFDLKSACAWPDNNFMLWGAHLPEAGALDRDTGHLPRLIGEVNAGPTASILALDIKRPPTDAAIKFLRQNWRDAWESERRDALGYTWPAPVPKSRVSYYFLPKGGKSRVTVPRIYPIALPLGEHLPLFAEVEPISQTPEWLKNVK